MRDTTRRALRTKPATRQLRFLVLLPIALFTGLAQAEWILDNDASALTFTTTKAVDVAEVHSFSELSGRVDEAGKATLSIDLASVDTNIAIRDERMQNLLFETDKFPAATLSAGVPIAALGTLRPGETTSVQLDGELELHGLSVPVNSEVAVIRLADDSLQVNSLAPVLINAKDAGLLEGIEKLREVAGLSSIGKSVAVSFQLNFKQL